MTKQTEPGSRSPLVRSGILVAGVSNAGAVGVMLLLLLEAPGSAIRPMGHAFVAFLFAAAGLLLGVPLCLLGAVLVRGWRRVVALLGILLCLAPFPLGSFTLHLVAHYVGLTLKP